MYRRCLFFSILRRIIFKALCLVAVFFSLGLRAQTSNEELKYIYLSSRVTDWIELYNSATTSRQTVRIFKPKLNSNIRADIFLLRDLTSTMDAWIPFIHVLNNYGFQVITLDYPGLELSEKLSFATPFNLRTFLLHLRQVRRLTMESLGRPLIFVGQGFGGLLASRLTESSEVGRLEEIPQSLYLVRPYPEELFQSPDSLLRNYMAASTFTKLKLEDIQPFEKIFRGLLTSWQNTKWQWDSDLPIAKCHSAQDVVNQILRSYGLSPSLSPSISPGFSNSLLASQISTQDSCVNAQVFP